MGSAVSQLTARGHCITVQLTTCWFYSRVSTGFHKTHNKRVGPKIGKSSLTRSLQSNEQAMHRNSRWLQTETITSKRCFPGSVIHSDDIAFLLGQHTIVWTVKNYPLAVLPRKMLELSLASFPRWRIWVCYVLNS